MGLEKVKERVLQEAREKAKARIDSATEEARKITEIASRQAKQKEAESKAKLEAEKDLVAIRKEAAAKLEAKKQMLSFKKAFIDAVFDEVKEKLEKLPEAKRAANSKALMKKAAEEISIALIYCNKKDRKTAGNNAKDAEILGGLIAESEDGTLRVDYSYETLLEQVKKALIPELNGMLFNRKK